MNCFEIVKFPIYRLKMKFIDSIYEKFFAQKYQIKFKKLISCKLIALHSEEQIGIFELLQ